MFEMVDMFLISKILARDARNNNTLIRQWRSYVQSSSTFTMSQDLQEITIVNWQCTASTRPPHPAPQAREGGLHLA